MTPKEALQEAVRLAGGTATGLATKLGGKVVRQNVEYWLSEGAKGAPAEHCPAIERETGVKCELLRPDVDWGVLRDPATVPSELTEG